MEMRCEDAPTFRKWLAIVALFVFCAGFQVLLFAAGGAASSQPRIGNIDDWFPPNIRTVELDIGEPMLLKAGDFNEDGQMDLLVAADSASGSNYQYRIFLLPGQVGGEFSEPLQVAQSPLLDDDGRSGSGTGVVADLDNDGHLDVIAFFGSSKSSPTMMLDPSTIINQFLILWGNGDGTFQKQWLDVSLRFGPPNIVVGDFDGDGHLDIAYSDWQHLSINVIYNRGQRVLEKLQTVSINKKNECSIAIPMLLAVADLNHDGKDDIVVGGSCSFDENGSTQYKRFVRAALSCGEGCFHLLPSYVFDTSDRYPFSPSFLVGDFNNDGNVDIVLTQPVSPQEGDNPSMPAIGAISMLSGNGDGSFNNPVRLGLCFSSDGLLRASGDTVTGLTFVLISRVGLGMVQGVPPYPDKTLSIPVEDLVDEVVTDIDNDGWAEIVAVVQHWQRKATILILRRSVR